MPYKVLHLIESDQRRGAEIFAAQLAQSMSYSSFRNGLCILNPTGAGGFGSLKYPIFRLSSKNGYRSSFRSKIVHFREILQCFKPHILLCHGASSLKYGFISRLLYNKRIIRIYRNIGTASYWANSVPKVWFNKFLLTPFDSIVSLSPKSAEDFCGTYAVEPPRLVIIPNGVQTTPYQIDLTYARNQYRSAFGWREDDIVLINIGSLSPEKNQTQLVSLVKDLGKQGVSVKLIQVGDGPLRVDLENKAREFGVQESVRFLGVRDDIPSILASSDIFLLPSLTEGMPAVLIEAGLAGLPSVAYNVGASADVIDDGMTGFIVPEGDYDTFKIRVVQLVESSNLRVNMGSLAQITCVDTFDINKISQMYDNLFMTLISSKESHSVG